jgi:hypothetical protein
MQKKKSFGTSSSKLDCCLTVHIGRMDGFLLSHPGIDHLHRLVPTASTSIVIATRPGSDSNTTSQAHQTTSVPVKNCLSRASEMILAWSLSSRRSYCHPFFVRRGLSTGHLYLYSHGHRLRIASYMCFSIRSRMLGVSMLPVMEIRPPCLVRISGHTVQYPPCFLLHWPFHIANAVSVWISLIPFPFIPAVSQTSSGSLQDISDTSLSLGSIDSASTQAFVEYRDSKSSYQA